MPELSVIIPARNEEWLSRTVEDVIAHSSDQTEVIVVLDGAWANPPLTQHPRVQVVKLPEAIGQRAATNLGARISTARYLMKLDAHASMADGFDVELMRTAQELGEDVTQIPAQFNFHVYDWMCDVCGNLHYQGPTPARCYNKDCASTSLHREIVWQPRLNRKTTAWIFDHDLRFGYSGQLQDRLKDTGDLTETLSCLGACWFLSRERFWQLGGLDEGHGSWGQMGTELACKSWLSGGRMVTNHRTSFAHMFRTQGGDFSFPYPISGTQQDKAREYSNWLWKGNNWPQAVHSLKWLVEKFAPVKGWTQEQIDDLSSQSDRVIGTATTRVSSEFIDSKGSGGVGFSGERGDSSDNDSRTPRAVVDSATSINTGRILSGLVYYSDSRGDETILSAVRGQLARAANGHQIVSVTLKPLDFGRNIVLPLERSPLTMFKQILAGLEVLDTYIAYLVEHDVLYSSDHLSFVPPRSDRYYYDQNFWRVDAATGRALYYRCNQTSGLCASRQLLVEHYRKRVAHVEQHGFSRRNGFEPGTRKLRHGGFDDVEYETWMAATPSIDVRHGHNLTPSRWKKEQFRDQRYCQDWRESDGVEGWGTTLGRFEAFLKELG